jgi:protein SCO1/2
MMRLVRAALVATACLPLWTRPASVSAAPASAPSTVDERVGAALPLEATFTTSEGREARLGEFFGNGRPGLLVLSYAHCAMLCSVVLRGVSDLLREYRATPDDRWVVVNVSIDPRETPHEAARVQATALARANLPGAVERFPFLVGDEPSIDAVAKATGFRYAWDEATRQYAHPAVLVVVSPEGRVARYLHGVRFEPEEVRAALHGKPAGPSLTEVVLSCFRSDVLERRYGGVIARSFQLGALLVLGALVALVVSLMRRKAPAAGGREPPA